MRRPQRQLDDEQRQRRRDRGRRSANDEPRPGKRQIEMRVSEHLGQLGGGRKHDRLAQRLPHRIIGERETGAERKDDQPGEERPSGGQTQ